MPPSAGEKFYACLLLSVLTDVWSFEHLRTVDDVVYPIYQEVCLAQGLLANDNEWKCTLEDGIHMQTGHQLCQLFITIMAHNQPSEPRELGWIFKLHLCDDLPHFLTCNYNSNLADNMLHNYRLYLIKVWLLKDDKMMDSVGLPNPQHDWDAQLLLDHSATSQFFDPVEQHNLFNDIFPHLNQEQLTAFNLILDAVHHSPLMFLLQGAAGAGKTFMYNTLCFATHSQNLQVLCVALSGIAALLLPIGRTAHSALKIPDINYTSTCSISLKNVHLLIWDKCSMQNHLTFKAVDQTLQDIWDTPALFRGITTVLSGHFLQTLPIVMSNSESETLNAALLSLSMEKAVAKRMQHDIVAYELIPTLCGKPSNLIFSD